MFVLFLALIIFSSFSNAVFAEKQEEEILVTAQKEIRTSDMPTFEGARIYSGKKSSTIALNEQPMIVNNNYRHALEKTSGLLLSEESTPLVSVGYRGLDPHRAQFTQILKDGIPIHADMIGYPEAYYSPSLDDVSRIDFIRGGAALLYGPQPGGALNFVTKDPYADAPLSIDFRNSGGSHGLFSHYTSLSGTQDRVGYLGSFHHRQSQGFRDHNSQYDVFNGYTKFKIENQPGEDWTIGLDAYNEDHGEPGGLTRSDSDSNPSKSNRLNDRFELNRYAGSLSFDKELDDQSFLGAKAFGGYYERASWRQRTSGGNFGLAPSGVNSTTNDIENQKFYTMGGEIRSRRGYEAFGHDDHAFTAGILYYHVTSPRIDKRGASADAEDGTIRKDFDRQVNYVSLFLENLFQFDRLSFTPGMRFENIWQGVKENINQDKTTVPLADSDEYDFVPLLGLGSEYEFNEAVQMYANISQGYRPKIFTQAVPTGSGQVVNEDLEEGKSWQADVGLRGNPVSFYSWDAGVFYMSFKDQIGTSGTTVDNVGDARHYGVELANQFGITSWFDERNKSDLTKHIGAVDVFANVMLLDAKFTQGPNKNKAPQYAPDFIFKTGVEYKYQELGKLSLAGTLVDDHFANDTNTSQFGVPSYKVWDLTGEVNLYKDNVSLFGGINNLFDEHYFARVRSDGIDPADGRNYYAGLKMIW